MTAVAQGTPGKEITIPDPLPEKPKLLTGLDVEHLSSLLRAASSWKHDHPKEESHRVASLADTDLTIPDEFPPHPEELRLEWITESVLREVIQILSRSTLEPFVIRRGNEYFLMVRRRHA